MSAALLIDFGSTYTKLRAVDVGRRALLGSGQGPSTVGTDILLGMNAALADLEGRLGGLPSFRYRLASSSAAGGLRMVTIGLVRELTLEAARFAALGAGARLVGTFANRLTSADLKSILALEPDILLLAGGTDGGNSEVILYNAKVLGASPLACPVIYAGNRVAADDAVPLLGAKQAVFTENVMPEFGQLNIEPARAAIREVFIARIVHAKGIDRAAEKFDAVLMPTPAAVMEGARLVADGCRGAGGLGDLVVIDPGGATTDVHSVSEGLSTNPGVIQRGLPEPRVKRTVEGDLGMRHNAAAIVEAAGSAAIASEAGLTEERLEAMIGALSRDVASLPGSSEEARLDRALARASLRIAMRRHCGRVETVYTALGPATAQDGKDLSAVGTLIGTGGVVAHSDDAAGLLSTVLADPAEPASLRPRAPRILVDREYVLYACGLLGQVEPDAALEFALKHLHSPFEESHRERSA